jgi:hypothetical protein
MTSDGTVHTTQPDSKLRQAAVHHATAFIMLSLTTRARYAPPHRRPRVHPHPLLRPRSETHAHFYRAPLPIQLSVKSKDGTTALTRAALDICCVIDVLGSMGSEAVIPADPATGSPAESTGLSVLDVVKHVLRMTGSTLQPQFRGIDRSRRFVSTLTSSILDAVKSLEPGGNTSFSY